MTIEELKQTAWIGDEFVDQPIRGVALSFHGLGDGELRTKPNEEEQVLANLGILPVWPYTGPWSWMNRGSRAVVDKVVAAIYSHFSIPDDAPLFSTGGSMGGHGALLYTRYAAARPVAACVAIYPVCDLKYHFQERADLPRTIRYALRDYNEDFESLLTEHSPMDQVSKMPHIPYFIAHGEKDQSVNKQIHSDKFVAAMKANGHSVTYMESPEMGHGPVTPEIQQAKFDFIRSFI